MNSARRRQRLVMVIVCCNLIGCAPTKEFVPERPAIPAQVSENEARQLADILRSKDKEFSHSINDSALTAVTRELGPTVIKVRDFPFRSEVAVAETTPWSAWWYPKKDTTLFDDSDTSQLSALTKLDILQRSRNPHAGSAAGYERKVYNANAAPWEGLCDAWALASLSRPEPKREVTMLVKDGATVSAVKFSVSDLKGLLLKTFESIEDQHLIYYGQKFTGDEKGWIYPDLFPEQLHRFIEVHLFERHTAFMMDHDSGVEIWNVPVFKANYTMDNIPGQPDAVFVRLWLYSAESVTAHEKSFVGTKEAVREYDYVLEGTRNSNGDLEISMGYWVKGPDGNDSRRDHPDFLTLIRDPGHLIRKSWNPEINIDLIDELLAKSY